MSSAGAGGEGAGGPLGLARRCGLSRGGCGRVGAMSKVELAGRPEPGYESMEQFSVSVEHVADMLRTIDFQPGAAPGRPAARAEPGRGAAGPPEG